MVRPSLERSGWAESAGAGCAEFKGSLEPSTHALSFPEAPQLLLPSLFCLVMCLFPLLDCGRQGWLCHVSAHQHCLAPGVLGSKVQDTQTAVLRGTGASVEEATAISAE